MKKAKPRKRKKKLTQYHEDVYPAHLYPSCVMVAVFSQWLPGAFGFMPSMTLDWLNRNGQVVSPDYQSLN